MPIRESRQAQDYRPRSQQERGSHTLASVWSHAVGACVELLITVRHADGRRLGVWIGIPVVLLCDVMLPGRPPPC